MTISSKGIALIQEFEGFMPNWYADPVGVRTIGYGWTHALPDHFSPPLSKGKAALLLRSTVLSYSECVSKRLKTEVNQNQFDALVSFTYNLGCGAMKRSTLMRRVNARRFDDVPAQFARWNKAGGRVLRGLTRRRHAEAKLFATPVDDPREEEMEKIPIRPPVEVKPKHV